MSFSKRRACNLGEMPQDVRLRMGAVSFALGLVLAVVMLKLGASTPVRLLLAVPFFVGANGLYMGLFSTCTTLAVQGMRDIGDGPTRIADHDELSRVRRTAMKLTAFAFLTGALATSFFVVLNHA